MVETQLVILRRGEEIFRAKLDAEIRCTNPVLSYDEDSYEEIHMADDICYSGLVSLLDTFREFVEGG